MPLRSLVLLLAAVVAALVAAAPVAAQSHLEPQDLDHVLGAALALTEQAADAVEGAVPLSAGDAVLSPDTLRGIQQRAFEAALVAQRAHTYLRLYVYHLGELGVAPPEGWSPLLDALAAASFEAAELIAVPVERLGEAPFDAAVRRAVDAALADRLRTLAAALGEAPGRYED